MGEIALPLNSMAEKDTKIVSFAIQKGGSGKSTHCYNLAYYCDRILNKKVLAIDVDYQCSISETFGHIGIENSSVNIFEGGEVDIIKITDNIDLIPAHPSLQTTPEKLRVQGRQNVYFILEDWLIDNYDRIKHYDYIFIDTHPDISSVTKNAIVVSDIQLGFVDPSSHGYNSIPKSMGSLETLKEETKDRRTKEIVVTAELLLIANRIKNNEKVSRDLLESLEGLENNFGVIENKSLYNHSTYYKTPVVEYLERPEVLKVKGNKEFKKRFMYMYDKIMKKIDSK